LAVPDSTRTIVEAIAALIPECAPVSNAAVSAEALSA
jgi:hypothetical protein